MDGVLAGAFSRSDAFKRKLIDALRNPRAKLEQVVGDANDRARALNEMTAAAGAEKELYGPASQALAMKMAEGYSPVGMTKVVGPQSAALETARKNAVKMLGLPENNTPMDRAKALGFKGDLYHGGTNNFPAFKVSDRSSIYATDTPEIADIYANAVGRHKALREVNAAPNVIPVMYRGKLLEVTDQGPGGGGWFNDNLAQALGVERRRGLTKELPQHGYSGLKISDMDDLGGRQSQYVFPDPTVLRSRFAAFDPARVNENNLLAGMLPLGAMTLPKDDENKRKQRKEQEDIIEALRRKKD